jgi:Zn-dependent protease/predicted transcriptional regulator
MRWSWKIGRIAGIDIRVHATMLLLLAYIALTPLIAGKGSATSICSLILMAAVFTVIVLHELGHALVARHFRVRTIDITLLPIGGISHLERIPQRPLEELLVAIAGPVVNGVLAVLAFAVAGALQATGVRSNAGVLVTEFARYNVALGVFNLIPALPMDGGRVLRATLAARMDPLRATELAAQIGQGIAVAFGIVGLVVSPILVLIAVFVWVGAAAERANASLRRTLQGITVRRAMVTDLRSLGPSDPLAIAVRASLSGFQQDFPVVAEGHLVGVLTRPDVLDAVARSGGRGTVGDAMRRELNPVEPDDTLDQTFERLLSTPGGTLPVVENEHVVGLLTRDGVSELLAVQGALHKGEAHGRPRLGA